MNESNTKGKNENRRNSSHGERQNEMQRTDWTVRNES